MEYKDRYTNDDNVYGAKTFPKENGVYNKTIVDANTNEFRYGLYRERSEGVTPLSMLEDPTYLGFTIEIDESSPFFDTDYINGFIDKYSTSLGAGTQRKSIYEEFRRIILTVMNSRETSAIAIKSHYINSINGFQFLTKKFVGEEDKLTINMAEDVTMLASYLSHLYNNLIYSYETGRTIFPENLLWFNMTIKISEMRNFTSITRLLNQSIVDNKTDLDIIRKDISAYHYTLRNCTFDFFNSKNITDELVNGGFNQSVKNTPETLTFDIKYQNVSRKLYANLIADSLVVDDSNKGLFDISVPNSNSSNTSLPPNSTNVNAQTNSNDNTVQKPTPATFKRKKEDYTPEQLKAITDGTIIESEGSTNSAVNVNSSFTNKKLSDLVKSEVSNKINDVASDLKRKFYNTDNKNLDKEFIDNNDVYETEVFRRNVYNSDFKNAVNQKLQQQLGGTVIGGVINSTVGQKALNLAESVIESELNKLKDEVLGSTFLPRNVYKDSFKSDLFKITGFADINLLSLVNKPINI